MHRLSYEFELDQSQRKLSQVGGQTIRKLNASRTFCLARAEERSWSTVILSQCLNAYALIGTNLYWSGIITNILKNELLNLEEAMKLKISTLSIRCISLHNNKINTFLFVLFSCVCERLCVRACVRACVSE